MLFRFCNLNYSTIESEIFFNKIKQPIIVTPGWSKSVTSILYIMNFKFIKDRIAVANCNHPD